MGIGAAYLWEAESPERKARWKGEVFEVRVSGACGCSLRSYRLLKTLCSPRNERVMEAPEKDCWLWGPPGKAAGPRVPGLSGFP